MKEIKDHELLISYLKTFELETIFNAEIMPHLSLLQFEQGSLICSQGDHSEYLYVLVKGKLKIFNTSTDGKTLILSFKKPIEVIGDIEYVRDIDII